MDRIQEKVRNNLGNSCKVFTIAETSKKLSYGNANPAIGNQ